jgi:hypothetical protein
VPGLVDPPVSGERRPSGVGVALAAEHPQVVGPDLVMSDPATRRRPGQCVTIFFRLTSLQATASSDPYPDHGSSPHS